MNKAYIKGRTLEYRVRDFLEKNNYFVVRQAKSAFPDLIAIKISGENMNEEGTFKRMGKNVLVECKYNKYLSAKEKLEIRRLSEILAARAFVFYMDKRKLKFYEVKRWNIENRKNKENGNTKLSIEVTEQGTTSQT